MASCGRACACGTCAIAIHTRTPCFITPRRTYTHTCTLVQQARPHARHTTRDTPRTSEAAWVTRSTNSVDGCCGTRTESLTNVEVEILIGDSVQTCLAVICSASRTSSTWRNAVQTISAAQICTCRACCIALFASGVLVWIGSCRITCCAFKFVELRTRFAS